MSLRLIITKKIIKMMGMKKIFSLPTDKMLEKIKKENQKKIIKTPKEGLKIKIGAHECLIIKNKKSTRKALLYLFGGGYIMGATKRDLILAKKLGKRANRDIWFPFYPLCTDFCIKETYKMVYETYSEMIKKYDEKNIALIGFSSGAALAIGLCLYNNEQNRPLPMPELIIAISPGSVPTTDKEKDEMKKLSSKDIMIDAKFMITIKDIMKHNQEAPNYMFSGTIGNFNNFPMTYFYYGSDEVLSVEAPYFKDAFKKYNVPCKIHIEPKMFHCYPMVSFVPEGKKTQNEIIEILKK